MNVNDRLVKLESMANIKRADDVFTEGEHKTIADYVKFRDGRLPMTDELQQRLDEMDERHEHKNMLEELFDELESEC